MKPLNQRAWIWLVVSPGNVVLERFAYRYRAEEYRRGMRIEDCSTLVKARGAEAPGKGRLWRGEGGAA